MMHHEDEINIVNTDTPYDALDRMQQELLLDYDLAKLAEQLSEKQLIVCSNMFRDNPLTQWELAKEMGISQKAVNKLTRKVFKKAKAIGEYNIEKL